MKDCILVSVDPSVLWIGTQNACVCIGTPRCQGWLDHCHILDLWTARLVGSCCQGWLDHCHFVEVGHVVEMSIHDICLVMVCTLLVGWRRLSSLFGWWLFCVWVLDGVPVGFFDDSSRRLRGMDNPSVIIWVCCVLYIYWRRAFYFIQAFAGHG